MTASICNSVLRKTAGTFWPTNLPEKMRRPRFNNGPPSRDYGRSNGGRHPTLSSGLHMHTIMYPPIKHICHTQKPHTHQHKMLNPTEALSYSFIHIPVLWIQLNFQTSENISSFPALQISQIAGDNEFQRTKELSSGFHSCSIPNSIYITKSILTHRTDFSPQ